MNRNKKISMAIIAGAAALFAGTSSHAALVLEETRTDGVVYHNGTYDVIDVILSSMTAAAGANSGTLSTSSTISLGGVGDNTTGPANSGPQAADPEILALNGTFTATGASAVLGTPGSATGARGYATHIISTGSPQYAGTTTSGGPYGASFVSLPTLDASALTGATGQVGTASNMQGTSTALNGTWSVTPTYNSDFSGNNQGGIEPGIDASEEGAPSGLIAEILVTPGAGFTFSGQYGDYGNGGNPQNLNFTVAGLGGGGHPIIALTAASGGAPTNYGTSKGTLTVTGNGGNYTPQFLPVSPAAVTGYVEGKGFSPATDNEIYGLDVTNLGTTAAVLATEINTSYGSTIATTTYPGPGANPLGGAYNIFLDFSTPPSGDNFLGFDFTQDPDALNQGATVASVALVPEPASIGLLMGASGLLLGRRKRKA